MRQSIILLKPTTDQLSAFVDALKRGWNPDNVRGRAGPDNIPSKKVITSNGGNLLERFTKEAAYGGKEALRWRIDL